MKGGGWWKKIRKREGETYLKEERGRFASELKEVNVYISLS